MGAAFAQLPEVLLAFEPMYVWPPPPPESPSSSASAARCAGSGRRFLRGEGPHSARRATKGSVVNQRAGDCIASPKRAWGPPELPWVLATSRSWASWAPPQSRTPGRRLLHRPDRTVPRARSVSAPPKMRSCDACPARHGSGRRQRALGGASQRAARAGRRVRALIVSGCMPAFQRARCVSACVRRAAASTQAKPAAPGAAGSQRVREGRVPAPP